MTPPSLTVQDRPVQALYSYIDGELASVERQDIRERTTLELDYANRNTIDIVTRVGDDMDGASDVYASAAALASHTTKDSWSGEVSNARSNVIRYLVTYDDGGHMTELRYASAAYNTVGTDADGISGMRYKNDSLGRVVQICYLTYVGSDGRADRADNFAVVGKANGIAGIEQEYDENDDKVLTRTIDSEGNPIENEDKGCECKHVGISRRLLVATRLNRRGWHD